MYGLLVTQGKVGKEQRKSFEIPTCSKFGEGIRKLIFGNT
jgi:hypothetical protein